MRITSARFRWLDELSWFRSPNSAARHLSSQDLLKALNLFVWIDSGEALKLRRDTSGFSHFEHDVPSLRIGK
ncbi:MULTISPECIES: hypothetical protein [unclassified Bradyrhizobium]|uniref:hypothetical protein n=1 Tax=unclassified Bradyrhizobium TaxID=2631580 RepID=UPI0028EBE40A|nr:MULTISPECIES: hypothetical protein [unclassified Bradyrhizobium]